MPCAEDGLHDVLSQTPCMPFLPQCRPLDGVCADDWTQCGGPEWSGSTCCWPGASCRVENVWFSQCVPDSDAKVPRPTRRDAGLLPGPPLDGCDDPVAPYEQVMYGWSTPPSPRRLGVFLAPKSCGVRAAWAGGYS